MSEPIADERSVAADRAAERLRLRGIDRTPGEKRSDGVAQVGSAHFRRDPAVVTKHSFLVEEKSFGRPPGVEKPDQLATRIPNDRECVPVLFRVFADFIPGLPPVAVDGHEEHSFRPIPGNEIAKSVVVVVRIRAERRPEDHDDRAMIALGLDQRERFALDGRRGEGRYSASDLERGRARGNEKREERGG